MQLVAAGKSPPSQTAQESLFFSLPNEVVLLIFSYLNHPRDLAVCSLTCWQWHQISQDQALWKSLYLHLFPGVPVRLGDNYIQAFRRQFPYYPSISKGIDTVQLFAKRSQMITAMLIAGGHLFTGDNRGNIVMQEIRTRSTPKLISKHLSAVRALAASKRKVFSASDNGEFKSWNIENCRMTLHFCCLKNPHSMAYAKKTAFLVYDDQSSKTLNFNTFKFRTLLCENQAAKAISCLAIANRMLYFGYRDGNIRAWNCKVGGWQNMLPSHTSSVNCLSAFENILVSASEDKVIRIWSTVINRCLKTLQAPMHSTCLSATAEGKIFFALDCNIHVWDLNPHYHLVFVNIAALFKNDPNNAMAQFEKMPQEEKDGVYTALGKLLKLDNSDLHAAAMAFYNCTSDQKSQVILNHLCRKLACDFEDTTQRLSALHERFNQLPDSVKNAIYCQLYQLRKYDRSLQDFSVEFFAPKLPHTFGKYLFFGVTHRDSTSSHSFKLLQSSPQQKALAIRKYLERFERSSIFKFSVNSKTL